jgi:putative ABC transport system substrate-binding protein
MRRRELMLLLGGAMTTARALRAQQKAMPVIGYLSQRSPADSASIVAAFREGLTWLR